jgi:hypothetical protein
VRALKDPDGKRGAARRDEYRDGLVASLGTTATLVARAIARTKKSPYFEGRRGTLRAPFHELCGDDGVKEDAARFLLDCAEVSADCWAAGGDRKAGLQFTTELWRSIIPRWQERFATHTHTLAWYMELGELDVRRIATWLAEELFFVYSDALELGAKPPISGPTVNPSFSPAELETIYYISGYLLGSVASRLGHADDESLAAGWVVNWVSCCKLPLSQALEQQLPIERTRFNDRGGLAYPSKEFFEFVQKVEHIYVANLTDAHVDAYGARLPKEIDAFVAGSEALRTEFQQLVVPTMPLEFQTQPVPEELFSVMFLKYARMRAKDFGRKLDLNHAEYRAQNASAANVSHRSSIAVTTANAKKRAKSCPPRVTSNKEVCPKFGKYLSGRHVQVCFMAATEEELEAGEEKRPTWFGGTITEVDTNFVLKGETIPVAWVHWDPIHEEEDSRFQLRDEPYWHGIIAGSWFVG